MIFFVSQPVSPEEPDLLAGHEHDDLVLVPMEPIITSDRLQRISAPSTGWSHRLLRAYSGALTFGDAYLLESRFGVRDVRSKGHWIGSSEV